MGEVPLDSSNFASAEGVYSDFKKSINAAIFDIYQEEDNEWPFSWTETSFVTTIGTNAYSKHASAVNLDWDSFQIKCAALTMYTLTRSGSTATGTVLAGHQLVTGDTVTIRGANQTEYNGSFIVTVTSATTFEFTVADTATTPATGTIIMYPDYTTRPLTWIEYDKYRKEGQRSHDQEMIKTNEFNKPEVVIRKPDNNFLLSPVPDRLYTVTYEYFSMPSDLETHSDVPLIPEVFKNVIVDGGIYHSYMYRDNVEQAAEVKNKFTDGINRMRRILIPQPHYMRVSN